MSGFSPRQLGKTGLRVSPLGIGGGNGLESDDLLYAFERGINYFFFSSDLHHVMYSQSVEAIKRLVRQGSAVRDKVVLATVSYVDDPQKLIGVMQDQFFELGIEYIDVFHWGWITNNHDVTALLQAAQSLKDGGSAAKEYRQFRAMQYQAWSVNEELLKRGLVRYVGMSFHSRRAARKVMNDVDVMMLRYNIARLEVEGTIFSYLSGDKDLDPGVVVFNVAHEGPLFFHTPPPHYPPGLYVPSTPDCYRFALSNPWVDVVLTGVTERREIDLALEAMEKGPLTEEECAFLREYGSIFADISLHQVNSLLHRNAGGKRYVAR